VLDLYHLILNDTNFGLEIETSKIYHRSLAKVIAKDVFQTAP
jgi:hypothetical protein